jgi:hypothetical protein
VGPQWVSEIQQPRVRYAVIDLLSSP